MVSDSWDGDVSVVETVRLARVSLWLWRTMTIRARSEEKHRSTDRGVAGGSRGRVIAIAALACGAVVPCVLGCQRTSDYDPPPALRPDAGDVPPDIADAAFEGAAPGKAPPPGAPGALPCEDASVCLDVVGPPPFPSLAGEDVLLRNLTRGEADGQRYGIAHDGAIVLVEAALWATSGEPITAEIFLWSGTSRTPLGASTLAATAFPTYDGTTSPNVTTLFRIDPPIFVKSGDTVDVIFQPWASAVGGIHKANVDPSSRIAYSDPAMVVPTQDWDFVSRLLMRP